MRNLYSLPNLYSAQMLEAEYIIIAPKVANARTTYFNIFSGFLFK